AFSRISLYSTPAAATSLTCQPRLLAARMTFSLEVSVSTRTTSSPWSKDLSFSRVMSTGWGQDSPRASMRSLMARLSLGSFLSHGEADKQQHGKADDDRGDTVRAHSLGGAGQAEVVGYCRPCNHTEDEHRGVTVAFPGHEELPSRAAARQGEGQARHHHAHEIPDLHSVRHRLVGEARPKLT